MLMATLGAIFLENVLVGEAKILGPGAIRASEGTVKAGQNF